MSFYESLSAAADNYGPADLQTLAAYRAWAFPPEVQAELHEPHFSLYEPENWVTVDGLNLFKTYCMSLHSTDVASVPIPTPAAFEQCKSYLLPPHLAAHPFFRNASIPTAAFAAFVAQAHPAPMPTAITVNGVERRIKPSKRAAATARPVSRFVIDLDEEESDDDWFADAEVGVVKSVCLEGMPRPNLKRGRPMI